jgi:hypothetical protein
MLFSATVTDPSSCQEGIMQFAPVAHKTSPDSSTPRQSTEVSRLERQVLRPWED